MTNIEFSALVTQRVSWLASLPLLITDGWITGVPGGAKVPSSLACRIAGEFLQQLPMLFENPLSGAAPKLILGPIPTGGVTVELVGDIFSLYANFLNSGQLEAEWLPVNGAPRDIEEAAPAGASKLLALIASTVHRLPDSPGVASAHAGKAL